MVLEEVKMIKGGEGKASIEVMVSEVAGCKQVLGKLGDKEVMSMSQGVDGLWRVTSSCALPTDPDAAQAHVVCMQAVLRASRDGEDEQATLRTFQERVDPWLMKCFGQAIARNREERNHRFLEEALELVQASGCTQSEAEQLVGYVYGRPVGELNQEVGGVMVTLAALCLAAGVDMHAAGELELARVWTKVEQIRAKQASKPKVGPLPM